MDDERTTANQSGDSSIVDNAGTDVYDGNNDSVADNDAESVDTVKESAEPDNAPQVLASGSSEGGGKRFELVLNPETGVRTVRLAPPLDSEDNVEATEDNAETKDTPALTDSIAKPQTKAEYTLDQFSEAIAKGEVDEARVPAQYNQQYADYKIKRAMEDYGRKQAETKEAETKIEKQLTPEEQAEATKDFYNKLNGEARKRAMEMMNLTEEGVEEIELLGSDDLDAFKSCCEWNRQQLISDLQQKASREQAAKENQQNIYKGIVDFVSDAKIKEPNFDAIDHLMQNRYKNLPYEKGKAAEDAIIALKNGTITEAQAETLRQYYEDVRREYYATKNNLSTKPRERRRPPSVEHSGDGSELARNTEMDFNALRNANGSRERKAWFAKYFNNKNR